MKLVFVIFSLLIPFTLVLGNPKTKVLKPKNVESKISIVISGKNRTYYPLLFKSSTVLVS